MEETTGTTQTEGQAAAGPETAPVPDSGTLEGQPTATSTTGIPDTGSPDTVFDPAEFDRLTGELPDNLKAQAAALRKSLQGSYTKKTQEIAKHRQKIEAYDAFYNNPIPQIQQMAQQLGYKLTRAEAQVVAEQTGQATNWEPQSWEEVLNRSKELAMSEIMAKFEPVLSEMQASRKSAIERQLSEIDPSWSQYEDQMVANLTAHPTLAKDPAMLYRLSVPPEVFESRATQRALAKLEAKGQLSKLSGSSTTNKTPKTGIPDGPITFQEAVRLAKAKLEEDGIRP